MRRRRRLVSPAAYHASEDGKCARVSAEFRSVWDWGAYSGYKIVGDKLLYGWGATQSQCEAVFGMTYDGTYAYTYNGLVAADGDQHHGLVGDYLDSLDELNTCMDATEFDCPLADCRARVVIG